MYSADLTAEERLKVKREFTKPKRCWVLVGTYSVGSVGLNLHRMCHWVVEFDCPPSLGMSDQALGRVRRIGETNTIQRAVLSVVNPFQNTRVYRMLEKACPESITELELDINIDAVAADQAERRPHANTTYRDIGSRWTRRYWYGDSAAYDRQCKWKLERNHFGPKTLWKKLDAQQRQVLIHL